MTYKHVKTKPNESKWPKFGAKYGVKTMLLTGTILSHKGTCWVAVIKLCLISLAKSLPSTLYSGGHTFCDKHMNCLFGLQVFPLI